MTAAEEPATVGDLMSPDPLVVWPDTSVSEVADLLDRAGISGVPVVDWSGYVVGVVSGSDLLRVRSTEALWADWSRLSARHIMSRPVLTVAVDTPIETAVHLMTERRVHRLVVVEGDGETPCGVLSSTDLVHAMAARSSEG